MALNPRIREQRLQNAISKLSMYYGLRSAEQDIIGIVRNVRSSTLGTTGIERGTSDISLSPIVTPTEQAIATLINNVFNSTIGALKIEDLALSIKNAINAPAQGPAAGSGGDGTSGNNSELAAEFGKIIQIIGDGQNVREIRRHFPPVYDKLKYAGVCSGEPPSIGGKSVPILNVPQSELPSDAGGSTAPDGRSTYSNVSMILINSPNLNISSRHTKAVTMFLNNVPRAEFAKALPYLEVNFEIPTPAIEEGTNRLLGPSIYKLIMGGVEAPQNSVLNDLQRANQFNVDTSSGNVTYTRLGMEVFLTPQILYNQKTTGDTNVRYNSILDPTRPVLTIKSFSTSEVPSYSTYSYRTAQLQLVLHDRSRMPDLAAFFRADLRGNTKVDIEYGWHHPEGELLRRQGRNTSPYPDLINGMRRREKFQIRNSSFQFNESGKVDISLELVTLGQSLINSQLIIGNSETAAGEIRQLNDDLERLSNLIARTSLRNSDTDSPSVRLNGVEVLEAASDTYSSGFSLDSDQRSEFRRLISSLDRDRAPEQFGQIREILTGIWGSDGSGGRNSRVARVRTSLQADITNVLNDMILYCNGRPPAPDTTARRRRTTTVENGWPTGAIGDPLVIRTNPNPTHVGSGRDGLPGLLGAGTISANSLPDWIRGEHNFQNYSVSLGTIMMHFVGRSLMRSNLFQEVQFIYYPFNENAAYANRLNVANFEVNLGMFADRLLNYRLNSANRSTNFTLTDFWSFITTNIINDFASTTYGLWDTNGTLYSRPRRREDSEDVWSTRVADDETTYNSRLSAILRDVTPTGEFRPPQLRMTTECLPVRTINETGEDISNTAQNILRIHIYDQQASTAPGIGELLMAERNRALSLDGRPRGEENTVTNWYGYRQRLIEQAASRNIIRNIGGPNATEQRYVIVGGSGRIKEFIMENSPYILPGTQNSLVKSVNLNSIQDDRVGTLNLVNSPRPSEIMAPNGEEPSGLPLQVIPVELGMTTAGCPLISFSSHYFVDLKSGTTADDLYSINRIDSSIDPGSYKTVLKLRPVSGYTRYRNYLNEIRQTIDHLTELGQTDDDINATAPRVPTESGVDRGMRR